MSIIRWDPFREMMSLRQAMDRLFEDAFVRPTRLLVGEGLQLALDMYHTPSDVVVKAALPGVKAEDVDITITGDTLTIKGEVKAEEEVKKEDYFYQERRFGSFSRTLSLPGALQTDKAQATFENGILTLTIPKADEAKPKVIKVTAKPTIEAPK